MYFVYAEKQGNVFFEGWRTRQIAFDTMRRYLYYSSGDLSPAQIAPPNALPESSPSTGSSHREVSSQHGTANIRETGFSSQPPSPRRPQIFPPPLTQPSSPKEVIWKRKMKVDMIVLVAKEHTFSLDDPHLKENDFFQLEVHGHTRSIQTGETPSPGPLLCPSTGLAGYPSRYACDNREFIKDRYFLRELYEALRDQFVGLRMERELLASQGHVTDPRFEKLQTIQSPRTKNELLAKGSRIKIIIRMRNEYELMRFWYVVQFVLGLDKLGTRPYRGLPPYDPRNGIVFAQIPMCVWHTFKSLDKAVIYLFQRGDLVGRSSQGELTVFLTGAFLCLTHDTILVLRDSGSIPRWMRLHDVRDFHYNASCARPFVTFLSDCGAPDIVFLPSAPLYGPQAIRQYNPMVETLRIRNVVRDTCFASVDIRRVIRISETQAPTVEAFVEALERENGRDLNFDPALNYTGAISCPLPTEQLANVWHEVQALFETRDPVALSQAAIPLYTNNTNDASLTSEHLLTVSRRLNRQRQSRDDVVGMPYDEARHVPASPLRLHRVNARLLTRASGHHLSTGVPRSRPEGSQHLADLAEGEGSTRNLNAAELSIGSYEGDPENRQPPSLPASVSCDCLAVSPGCTMAASIEYALPGARYITQDELKLDGAGEHGLQDIVFEHHSIIMGQTPMAGSLGVRGSGSPLHLLPEDGEMSVDELMCRSLTAMRNSFTVASDGKAMLPRLSPSHNDGVGMQKRAPGKGSTNSASWPSVPEDTSVET